MNLFTYGQQKPVIDKWQLDVSPVCEIGKYFGGGSLILMRGDFNFIITCFKCCLYNCFKNVFLFFFLYWASLLPSFALWFDIWNQINAVITQTRSWKTKIIKMSMYNSSEYKTNSETQKVNRLSYVKYWTLRNWLVTTIWYLAPI